MTYIEFFDKEPMENICSCIARRPDRVIFVGRDEAKMKKHIPRYQRIFSDRGFAIRFDMLSVKNDNLEGIVNKLVKVLEEKIDENESFIFDLTGGDDLCLVAMGIVFEKFSGCGIQMHRFNLSNNTITDCDADGNVLSESEAPAITIEEIIRAFGGDIVYGSEERQGTVGWVRSKEFDDDVDSLWAVLTVVGRNRSFGVWNKQCDVFATIEKYGTAEGLTSSISVSALAGGLQAEGRDRPADAKMMLEKLEHYHLVSYKEEDGLVTVTYKSEQVKRCLIKAGQALETVVYIYALQAMDKHGRPVYNDVMNGVYIDWDGDIRTEQERFDTVNEIDVMMMRGFVPVFVSCKNGTLEMDELYKLNAVAAKFGGKYAKKMLVTTSLGRCNFASYFRQRAEDMGIVLLEPARLSKDEFLKAIKEAWSNPPKPARL